LPPIDEDGQVKCRVCACTGRRSCNPPCHRVKEDLCSTCLEAVQAVLYWRQSAFKPNRNALWMEVSRLYCRILREQKKSAAADVQQTGRLEGGSPMSAPAQPVADGTALAAPTRLPSE